MDTNEVLIPIPGRLHSVAESGHVAGADEIYDDSLGKSQGEINGEVNESLGAGGSVDERIASAVLVETERAQGVEATKANATDVYTKNETYNKTELNNLITTPSQQYITVAADDQTTAVTDVLPATGSADTVYRVGNWDGEQYDTTCYTEYAWNGSAYVLLNVKEVGIDDKPTAGSENLVKSGGVAEKTNCLEINASELAIPSPSSVAEGYRISTNNSYSETDMSDTSVVAASSFSLLKYNVTAGKKYAMDYHIVGNYGFWAIWFLDSNGQFFLRKCQTNGSGPTDYNDFIVVAPEGAVEMWMQVVNVQPNHSFKEVVGMIPSQNLLDEISQVNKDLEITSSYISKLSELSITSKTEGYRISTNNSYSETDMSDTSVVAASSFSLLKYNVTAGKKYAMDYHIVGNYGFWAIWFLDSNGQFFLRKCQTNGSGPTDYNDFIVVAPEGAVEMWMQVVNVQPNHSFKEVGEEMISSDNLDSRITAIEGSLKEKLMKVVINDLDGAVETTPFYIRSRYNESKDVIITHRVNSNGCVTFRDTYIGANTLTDGQLMRSSYLVSAHQDSTSPLYGVSQYWHLFAQHGYVIPYINNPGLTNSDIGAEWKDQSDRHYKIGNVSNDRVWLLPVIYTQGGHSVRDWKTPSSTAITTLQHVSGGSYTTDISVSGYGNTQLFPVMQKTNRIWRVDNKEVTEAGVYYCDELSVSESQIGYDPATVQTWFDSNGKVDLTGALPMAKLTYSFNYKGAQCCVNTTINILRSIDCTIYGGTQQQFFFDNGDYKAMFMIPKAKSRNGVDFEKPFNSPSSGSTAYVFYRDAASLNDVDDIIDRQIGLLQNPNTNDYLVGMAAGLSLVSGDTVKVKRNQNCLTGNTNTHYMVLNFSPANTNKFYVAAFNCSPYENNDYYLPAGFFKEVNYYVSYFDPAENEGQVYWYKDCNSYIIYAHCQSVQSAIAIKVPDFMEGLNLTVVEKTSNTDLLTDTIANGKFFVNYNTNDANYIVVKAE